MLQLPVQQRLELLEQESNAWKQDSQALRQQLHALKYRLRLVLTVTVISVLIVCAAGAARLFAEVFQLQDPKTQENSSRFYHAV